MEPYRVRVIYGDTDQMGVVYYANYLRFFEGARGHFIRGLGLSYREIESRGILLPVLEASVQYLKSAKYEDVLEVHLSETHTRVKIRFEYKVHREQDGAVIALGHTVHVCVGPELRPTRAPEWLLQKLQGGRLELRSSATAGQEGKRNG
ncbi:MAG: acyl-CoA thioesterase [Deltaproteobacteria bacterium]|nr:MAG: acyl-CoA thioesterase [Deltaproteobacteria bacterium]TMB15995.1 MAG: acyl-CoA thioesterase [Deltaproteobacteria bacterium]